MRVPSSVLGVAIVVWACAAPPPAPPVASGPATVAVLPFRAPGGLDEAGAFVERTGADADETAAAAATTALAQRLVETGVAVVDATAAAPPPGAARYDAALAARVARRLGAAYAVLGATSRFVQREGSAWGVRSPGSIAYDVVLVRVSDAAVVLLDRFDYTQRPLSENLLDLPRFVRGGGSWMTREEILADATRGTARKVADALSASPAR